jgi:hypothetical protein
MSAVMDEAAPVDAVKLAPRMARLFAGGPPDRQQKWCSN